MPTYTARWRSPEVRALPGHTAADAGVIETASKAPPAEPLTDPSEPPGS
jgi:hypothetical protein